MTAAPVEPTLDPAAPELRFAASRTIGRATNENQATSVGRAARRARLPRRTALAAGRDGRRRRAAPALGPVADAVALYETVQGMRTARITRTTLLAPIVATAIPLIPVAATQVPLKEIAKKLLAELVGVKTWRSKAKEAR